MAYMAPAVVPGAPRQALPYGLFSVLAPRDSAERWEGGVEFEGLGCLPPAGGGEIGPLDCEVEETPGLPKTFEGGVPRGEAEPFYVYETYVCSPIGNTLERANEVAAERLSFREEWRVERALSSRLLANPDLTDLGEQAGIKEAVALLEQQLAESYGLLGVLHMSRFTATLALEKGVVESKNGRLVTKLGTPVVAGGGYTFEGIIATPALFGYRSEVFNSSRILGDLLDRSVNDLYGIAERAWLIAIDPCGLWVATFADTGGGGVPGPAGKSAYEIAVDNGFEGTETEWLASLVGPAGTAATIAVGDVATGAPGSPATVTNSGTPEAAVLDFSIPSGAPGADGDDGAPGAPGVVQAIVAGDGIAVDATDPANPVISAAE